MDWFVVKVLVKAMHLSWVTDWEVIFSIHDDQEGQAAGPIKGAKISACSPHDSGRLCQ
jgi:hypothetical protein